MPVPPSFLVKDIRVKESIKAPYSLKNAVRIAYDADLGRKLAGEAPLTPPKNGAQFHFSLPRSVQDVLATRNDLLPNLVKVEQAIDDQGLSRLAIDLNGWANAVEPVEMLTQVFTPPEIVKMKTYDLMAAPLVSPVQVVTAVLRADSSNTRSISANLRLKHYNAADTLSTFDRPPTTLCPGKEQTLTWTTPDAFDSQPIQQLGLALSCAKEYLAGTIGLDSLSYSGSPRMTLQRPTAAKSDPFQPAGASKPCKFWTRAWIDSLSTFHKLPGVSFCLAQDQGLGVLITGTRDWIDYKVAVPSFRINRESAGLAVRVRIDITHLSSNPMEGVWR